ncbi:MAG: hypothetical protein QM714_10955 [Nocardioides sp.]|uniref:hypothetical protein n=1 Tax=Nocardioides sp. TaxID=35761 RepID=UPI0039E47550
MIRAQLVADGRDPSGLYRERRIPGAAKNGSGNYGLADIVYISPDKSVAWVWEVKSLGRAYRATGEAEAYGEKLVEARMAREALLGWAIGGPWAVSGIGPRAPTSFWGYGNGQVIYTRATRPKSVPYEVPRAVRKPVEVPDEVPREVPLRVPVTAQPPGSPPVFAPAPPGVRAQFPTINLPAPPEGLVTAGKWVATGAVIAGVGVAGFGACTLSFGMACPAN